MGEATRSRTPDIQLFRDVFNASPIGIAVETLEGQPLFVNPAFCSMLGFSEEELRYKHCVEFSPPEDAQKDSALFQQLKAGSIDHYQLEKRYFRKDGSLVWGRVIISLLKSRPSPLVLAMLEDVTDKKKTEEVRFRHAAVIESSDDAIASGTLDGTIVSWNTGAERTYGYTEAEAVGKPINMLVPPELPDEENKILEMLRAGGRIQHFETVRVTKTGKRINVSLTISPIKDSSGRTVGCSGIARDISERKLAEEALRASEERLRLAQQAARIGTFERDVRTGGVTWAAGLESLYGMPPGSLDGKTTAFFSELIHPADRERVAHLIQEGLKTGRRTEGEWRVIWPDGSVHWIAGRWQVLLDESGEPLRVFGVNLDVTDRKRAEEALSSMNRRVIEAEERERNRVAKDLHEDVGQRLALLAIGIEQLKNDLPNRNVELLDRMDAVWKQTLEILTDVKGSAHELYSPRLEYLGVAAVMRIFCEEFGERKKVEIDFRSHCLTSLVQPEVSICLFRVLQEALHNGVKHSGVKKFEVRLWGAAEEIHLTVMDSGAGFDTDAARKDRGLGLTRMEQRVRLVNGTFSIDSQPEKGTTVHVSVPLNSGRDSMRATG